MPEPGQADRVEKCNEISVKSSRVRGFPACDIPLRQILPGINHTASAGPQDVVNGEG
jgi:hypothetical protein